jgi:hypothetical protein
MCRVVRPGGLIFLLAPSRGSEYRYPIHCWRLYPDGFRALAKGLVSVCQRCRPIGRKIQVRIALRGVIPWECFADMLKQSLAGFGAFTAAIDPLVWYSEGPPGSCHQSHLATGNLSRSISGDGKRCRTDDPLEWKLLIESDHRAVAHGRAS